MKGRVGDVISAPVQLLWGATSLNDDEHPSGDLEQHLRSRAMHNIVVSRGPKHAGETCQKPWHAVAGGATET